MNELKIHSYIMPGIESNMYLTMTDGSVLIVDPNVNSDALALMTQGQARSVLVLLTHEHYDHISGINWLRENFTDSAVEVVATEAAAGALQDPSQNLAKFCEILLMGKQPEKKTGGYVGCGHQLFLPRGPDVFRGTSIVLGGTRDTDAIGAGAFQGRRTYFS